jgi:predicted TPR repeat methyltransferase
MANPDTLPGGKPDLEAAYDLQTPDDSRRLYRDWAETYDQNFVAAKAYEYPARIAEIFDQRCGVGPVLDVGCGTGAVAEALSARPVDGVDISPEMLGAAEAKGLYRALFETNLMAEPDLPQRAYRGVVSAGTFTHGHVGPEALITLTHTAEAGALFVIGVNAEVFARAEFQRILDQLLATNLITDLELVKGRIYGAEASHDHRDDLFCAAVFRKV